MAKNKIKLEGWFSEATLGGSFKVFRGYADIKTLADISSAFYHKETDNTGYQREILPDHARDIKTFFEEQSYRFTPEVILGVRLDPEEKVITLSSGFTEEEKRMLLTPEVGTTEVSDISESSKPAIRLGKKASITINLDELNMHKDTIRRVDGNHRLFLATELKDDPNSPNKYVVSYCMILLGPTANTYDDIAEARVFYNINQKAIPITSEHGFHVLLTADMEEGRLFIEDPLLFCAQYLKRELEHCSPELKATFGHLPLTNLHDLVKILKEQELIKFEAIEEVKAALKDLFAKINQHYCWALTEGLRIASTFKIVPAILLMLLDDATNKIIPYWLRSYDRWIVSNHLLDNFESMKPSEIWDVFKKWKESQPKIIFVACSFRDAEELKSVKQMIEEAIKGLQDKHPDIRIEQVRIDEQRGESFELSAEIFNQIDDADLVIADLTDEKQNVYCEVGYAKARGIPFILAFRAKNPEETEKKNKIHVDLQPYKYIPYTETPTLRDELIKELEAFYALA